MSKKEIKKWEILSSEYLFRRPWLTARRDHVRLPSGVEHNEFYILEYPTWVNVIAITKDGKFIVERQYRHGIQDVRYEICAGVCEEGEEPIEAAKRELLEETGYAGGTWRHFMWLSGNASSTTNYSHTFIAEGVEPVAGQSLEPTEDIEIYLMTEQEVFKLLEDGEFVQSLMAAPLWRYFYEVKGKR